MRIWVDADACPKVIKEILFRAAERARIPLTLVANMKLQHPQSAYIDAVRVAAGADVADAWIIEHAAPGDLAITADIPLAAGMIDKGGFALNPRGDVHQGECARSPEHAQLHGQATRRRRDDGRAGGILAGRPAGLRQPAGQVSDRPQEKEKG